MKHFLLLTAMLAIFLFGLARAVEAAPRAECDACRKLETSRLALEDAHPADKSRKRLSGMESLYEGLKDWHAVKADREAKADFLRQYILLSDLLMTESGEPDAVECLATIRRRDETAFQNQLNEMPAETRRRVSDRLESFRRPTR